MTINNHPTVILTHTLPVEWIQSIQEECNLIIGPEDATSMAPELVARLPEAEGLFTLLTIPISKQVLQNAPKLKVISNMAVGVDNIDIKACTERGIPVGNTPGVLTESTADLTMALMLSVARNLPQASEDARTGHWKTWSPAGWLGMELNGATLGIIGMGKIGNAVAKRASAFGMHILYADPGTIDSSFGQPVSIDSLLAESDIVTLHAPLTPETRGIINREKLAMMKPTALLINAARGPLIETVALVEALENNRIAAAALDVTDPEPLPPSHPLYQLPNCLIVPHIGSATRQTRRKMAELACENLLAGLHGEHLPHCVNPEVYLK